MSLLLVLVVVCLLFSDTNAGWKENKATWNAYRKADVKQNMDDAYSLYPAREYYMDDCFDLCETSGSGPSYIKTPQSIFAEMHQRWDALCTCFKNRLQLTDKAIKDGVVPLTKAQVFEEQDIGVYYIPPPLPECEKPEVAEWNQNAMTYAYNEGIVTLKCADKFRLSNEPTKSTASATCTPELEWDPSTFHDLECHPQCASDLNHLNITSAMKTQLAIEKSATTDKFDINIKGCETEEEKIYWACGENDLWPGNIQDAHVQHVKSTHRLCKN